MRITICLITKGRFEYLSDCLAGLEACLEYDFIDVLIVDNGSESRCATELKRWVTDNSQRAKLVRLEKNDPRPRTMVNIFREMNLQWVITPGDDDILNANILPQVQSVIESDLSLGAVTTSARIINQNGKFTGAHINAGVSAFNDSAMQLAGAIHEPPFFWPGTFWNVSALPDEIPNTRYVFDWWVGINIVLSRKVCSVQGTGIHYRVHSSQESFQSGNIRKYFEASLMLSDVIESDLFRERINTFTPKDQNVFWKQILESGAVYGDLVFSESILSRIYKVIRDSSPASINHEKYMQLYMASKGLFIRAEDMTNFYSPEIFENPDFGDNFYFSFVPGVCQPVTELEKHGSNTEWAHKLLVGCNHSKRIDECYEIDCRKLI